MTVPSPTTTDAVFPAQPGLAWCACSPSGAVAQWSFRLVPRRLARPARPPNKPQPLQAPRAYPGWPAQGTRRGCVQPKSRAAGAHGRSDLGGRSRRGSNEATRPLLLGPGPQPSARYPAGAGGVARADPGRSGVGGGDCGEPSRHGPQGPRCAGVTRAECRRGRPRSVRARRDGAPIRRSPG
jgi:hypothetical protein